MVTHAYDYPKPQQTRNLLNLLLGDGLLVAEGLNFEFPNCGGKLNCIGAAHKRQRRALDAAFSVPKIKDLTHLFWGPSDKLVHKLNEVFS